jgi:hypothetical protein
MPTINLIDANNQLDGCYAPPFSKAGKTSIQGKMDSYPDFVKQQA